MTQASTKSQQLDHTGTTMKTVRFSTVLQVANTPSWYSEQDDSDWWWSTDDMTALREEAGDIVDRVMQGSDVIWARADRPSYCKTITKVHRACIHEKVLSRSTKANLEFWVGVGHSRRGLEHYILEEIQCCREQRRAQLMTAVSTAQEQCEQEKLTQDQMCQLLRAASECISKPAKIFAYRLAAADYEAVKDEYEKLRIKGGTRNKRKQQRKRLSDTKRQLSESSGELCSQLEQVRMNPAAA